MMMTLRPADDRGKSNLGWLESRFTFSFDRYFDPKFMQFRDLRVMNYDLIQPETGFGTHPHRDMEIITYVINGSVAHKDSEGNEETVSAGEVQRMTAGTGILHSEKNPSSDEVLELYQIWVLPEKNGLDPSYEQKKFTREDKLNRLTPIVTPKNRPQEGAITIHQDVSISASILESGKTLEHETQEGRAMWLQVVNGELEVDGQSLSKGDGINTESAGKIAISAKSESEFLVFDLR